MDKRQLQSVADIQKALSEKEVSAVEVAQDFLSRIKEKNGELNAFVQVEEDRVLARAKEIDEAGEGHLFGIPYAVKDNMLVEGYRATAGSKMLADYTAPYTATAVKKINDAGGVVLGVTNMDEFAMGSSTETSAYGPTKNPHDTTRVPGGSSGGSAVAVASGMAPFALGSDTGGSIRQPAALCGVVGYKPTYGAVSRHGLIAMASSLDQIGTFTRTVADAQIVAPFLIGKDPMDATSEGLLWNPSDKTPEKIRIGVVKEHFGEGIHNGVRERVEAVIASYEKMGATIEEVELPHSRYGLAAYYILMPSEVSSNLARFDGIRYGLATEGESMAEEYLIRRHGGFGPEVQRRIMLGTYALSSGYYDAYYLKAQKVRALIAEDYRKAFEKVDVILGPTAPNPAFRLGEKTSDPLQMYLEDIYTVGINLAGLPALSMPAGTIEVEGSNLPVGVQLVAPQKRDAELLEIASWYERGVNGV
ncbi:MAG: Asp-tRNA(Asn)/Glu-tRNA(Gln) amidotransferase subunit GatA [Candidatus Spechtbacterales bacterium]